MNSYQAASNSDQNFILTIWRDHVGQTQFDAYGSLSPAQVTEKLAKYLDDGSKLVWVHLYGNDPNHFESLLSLTRTKNHERLRHSFHDLLDPIGQQTLATEIRNSGTPVSRSDFFIDGSGSGSVVFMPVAQYRCLDQNQGMATIEQVVDIARRLKDGDFKEVLTKDQLWAVYGQNLVLTSTPSPMKHDVFRRLFDDFRNRCTPTPTQDSPLSSTALFSLVFSKCMRNQSDFLEASQIVINEALTKGVTAFNELHEQLKKLPEPEETEYDSVLRQLIDKLVRIQDEIRWLNIISTVSQNTAIFFDACKKQNDVKQNLLATIVRRRMKEGIGELYESQLRNWDRAIINQLNIMTQLNEYEIPNVKAKIKDLFDFKQSLSNVLSSQFQLRQADASTRSGNIIMYFTMMTILFSSLSFMAAFFAINIRSFPRNDQGDVELSMSYVASRIAAWSIAIAAPFWLLAAFLNPVADFLNWLLPGWLSPRKFSSNTGDPKIQSRDGNTV